MEQQLQQLIDKVTEFGVNQNVVLTRLTTLESEISDIKAREADNENFSSGRTRVDESQHVNNNGGRTEPAAQPSPPGPVTGASGTPAHTATSPAGFYAAEAQHTVQDEYQSIKDKVSSVKIPPEYRVVNTRTGIKREDNNTANLISNSAKYVETTLKILWNVEETVSKEQLLDIFSVQKAHIDYLRQEHSALVVAGQFGPKTSTLFKNLNRGTSNLDDRQLDTLLKAVQITSNSGDNARVSRGGFANRAGRGGWYARGGGGGGGGGRGYSRGANHSGNNTNSWRAPQEDNNARSDD